MLAITSSLRSWVKPWIYHQHFRKARDVSAVVWMAQMPPKSWEFEPGIQLLLCVNFQVLDLGVGSVKRVGGASALCAELHLLLIRGPKACRWIPSSASS